MKINNKKKLLGTLAIGGLVLSAPFAAFATTKSTDIDNIQKFEGHKMKNQMSGNLLFEPDYQKQLEHLEVTIERKIEQANYLIEELNDMNIETDELTTIVSEYVELEVFLDSVDISEEEADYLKEIFLEQKEVATNLTTEFREIITSDLTENQINTLRESMKENFKPEIKDKMKISRGASNNEINIEALKIIDENLAQKYEAGELTEQEFLDEINIIMDSFSEEEILSLREELKEAKLGPLNMFKGNYHHR